MQDIFIYNLGRKFIKEQIAGAFHPQALSMHAGFLYELIHLEGLLPTKYVSMNCNDAWQ